MATGLKEMIHEAAGSVDDISAADLQRALDRGEVDLVIDVREPGEWSEGHIPGAMHVPRGMLELRAASDSPVAEPKLTERRDARIVTYCLKRPGARSLLAARTLAQMGYANVAAMRGGLSEWSEQELPVERD
jgi:rhodanese-related sulfurtransferase